ncbi:S8 family peptidase [Shewanella sp. VB17]|uniref:S8 family peptidase n=1 Tax=Shewanella sp. VB17 TaxID=2739432 RepID=UPI0015644C66|nr:S8 family peptidase [Shewanella sp. VB17]NRD72158.1 S8 family peptidase [Shewanella sp. VB17]
MANNAFNKPHFFLNSIATSQNFTTPSRRILPVPIPEQDCQVHSGKLRGDLATVTTQLSALKNSAADIALQMGVGIQVEFESFPDIDLAFESLANATHGIDLHNIKVIKDGELTKNIATVFVPDGKLNEFEKKIEAYLSQKKHKNLFNTIQSIRTAAFAAIWSDDDSFLPDDKDEIVWWEVWISTPKKSRESTNNYGKIISDFTLIADDLEIVVSPHKLRFPEHTVIQVNATQNQLANSTLLLSRVAEIRAPKVTTDFFDSTDNEEQEQWSQDLLSRLDQPNSGSEPYICILDSGVNVEHPLLSPFAGTNDQLTITDDRVAIDTQGHGTGIAGLAMWGDLTDILGSDLRETINHKLESVRVIAQNGDNKDKPLGRVTSDAISIAEIANPGRDRTFSMSLSANTETNRGRPSSWSSSLDSLAVDYLGEGENPRLFTICAGNTSFNCFTPEQFPYPDFNQAQDMHDPAQAWNVISVGAYTNKVIISESSDYYPLANVGGLSPHSTTSIVWDRKNAPIKPEVVFEGGNIGKGEHDYRDDIFDFHLLTTHHDFSQRNFQTSNATSAATALAARFTAQVKAEYSNLWPETIRALTVHSAEWTDEMYSIISAKRSDKNIKKGDMSKLTRMVGFGVPNLEKAIKTANNSLSLVIQDELQPFHKSNGSIKTKDMHLLDLPWPREALQAIAEANVELTITLSYFVEPNPSSRNTLNKYSYASHQLRFDVKRPEESEFDFERRINAAAEGDKADDSPSDSNWTLGAANRHKGSIHKDIWKGSAAELADRGKIAIFPANGWWRTRPSHQRWDSKARYALIISLSVPEVDVDIYTEVKTKIAVMVTASSTVNLGT